MLKLFQLQLLQLIITALQQLHTQHHQAQLQLVVLLKAQFLAAGGTEELWNAIVMPESGGNVNASNGQYHGLGQTNQSWGYGSVSNQTKGMISYAKERYGSIGNAISFRQANGWW